MISYKVELTSSKIMAFCILIIGSLYSYINKDGNILTYTFTMSSAIVMAKTGFSATQDIMGKKYEVNSGSSTSTKKNNKTVITNNEQSEG